MGVLIELQGGDESAGSQWWKIMKGDIPNFNYQWINDVTEPDLRLTSAICSTGELREMLNDGTLRKDGRLQYYGDGRIR